MGWFVLAGILLLSICATGLPLPQGGVGSGAHGQPQAGLSSTPGPGGVGAGGGGGGGGGDGGIGIGTVAGGAVVGGSGIGGGAGGGAAGGGSPSGGSSSGAATVVGSGVTGGSTGGGAGGGAAGGGGWSSGPARRGRGWRDWRRGDPTLIKGLWKSKGPLDSLGNAEAYIILALLIGFISVVIGCWLSDNCWSPEPEGGVVTLA